MSVLIDCQVDGPEDDGDAGDVLASGVGQSLSRLKPLHICEEVEVRIDRVDG